MDDSFGLTVPRALADLCNQREMALLVYDMQVGIVSQVKDGPATAMAWQRVDRSEEVEPWFLRDTRGFALAPELVPLSNEAVFAKITMSAFEGTPLAIAGIAVEIGIEPTARTRRRSRHRSRPPRRPSGHHVRRSGCASVVNTTFARSTAFGSAMR
jgi:biuret amidohydrolase